MPELIAHSAGRLVRIERSALARLGSGVSGSVYAVTQGRCKGFALKEYDPGMAPLPAKLETMLRQPPAGVIIGNSGTPQFAWPMALVTDGHGAVAGFLMAEVSHAHSTSLVPYITRSEGLRQLTPHERSLPSRYLLCRNISVALDALHSVGHAVIDLKDLNLRVHRNTLLITLIDTDGFSIGDRVSGRRFPADHYSAGYIAPEALKSGAQPSTLGIEQDLWAAAVLFFEVLTFGFHPFQGVAASLGKSNDDGVRTGIYAYAQSAGKSAHRIPDCPVNSLDPGTLELFERAFLQGPNRRPSAATWTRHFQRILP